MSSSDSEVEYDPVVSYTHFKIREKIQLLTSYLRGGVFNELCIINAQKYFDLYIVGMADTLKVISMIVKDVNSQTFNLKGLENEYKEVFDMKDDKFDDYSKIRFYHQRMQVLSHYVERVTLDMFKSIELRYALDVIYNNIQKFIFHTNILTLKSYELLSLLTAEFNKIKNKNRNVFI